jgi:hypothetical protein
MTSALLILALTMTPGDDLSYKGKDRKPHPLAPSLPLLTAEEYGEIEAVIDRFILYDTGKLKGAEGKKALEEFQALGPAAIPALIEGLNKAANLQHSCPAVLIGKKLSRLLGASKDLQLLDYARENIGAGVTVQRHMGVIKDLRIGCLLRKSYVQRLALASSSGGGEERSLRSTPVTQLAKAAAKERGPKLKAILGEVERRTGPVALDTLAIAAADTNKEVRELAQPILRRHLARLSPGQLKPKLKDDRVEVRRAAALAAGQRKLPWGPELIALLDDEEAAVCQAARQALVQLSGGMDFGPEAKATPQERAAASSRWYKWWTTRRPSTR